MLTTERFSFTRKQLLILITITMSVWSSGSIADNNGLSNAKNIIATTDYICGNVEKLVCVHKQDTTLNWTSDLHNTGGIVTSSNNDLVITSSSGLFSFTAAGKQKWQNTEYGNLFPAVKRNNQLWVGSNEHGVLSYSLDTGQLLWQYKLPTWVYSPAIVGDTALIVGNDATLYAAASLTGKKKWQRVLPQEPVLAPISTNKGIIVSLFNASVAHYAATDGKLLWSIDTPAIVTDMEQDKDTLFISDRSGTITAIDINNGQQQWQQSTTQQTSYTLSQDSLNLYLNDQQKNIIVANKETGLFHSTFSVNTTPLTPVIRIENSVYVMTNPRKPFNNFVLTKLN